MRRPLVNRYAPFLAIVALLGLLMVTEPDEAAGPGSESVVGAGGELGSGSALGGAVAAGGAEASGASGTEAAGGDTTGAGGSTSGGTGSFGPSGGGRTGTGSGGTTSGQRVDALGRPVEGDRSKCAPGGQIQENVTTYSLPCIPKFVGDNGGVTYGGVTKDEIRMVVLVTHFEPAVQVALQGVGLAATDQQYAEASDVFAAFINKRYELYGRKIKPIIHAIDCTDNPCYRAEAKASIAKHKPFAVLWFIPGIGPEAFFDEVSRAKVVTMGSAGLPTEWFVQRRPYVWTEVAQAPRSVDAVAEYYCKKMWGKNATLAGDPAMRVQRRKLGIVVSEEPNNLANAQHVRKQVTGGMCGSAADGTQLYTYSTDADQAEAQLPTLVAKMKSDGITTRLTLPGADTLGCTECDKQQYRPEHLISGQNQTDADIVGRLDASSQRESRFGIGYRPAPTPLNDHDFRRAAHDMNPDYDPEFITEGPYLALAMAGRMISLAGPRLTPATMEQGAHSMPQLGGWTNPNPWPGWKCCNPYVVKWSLAGTTNYSAWGDAREIYWSDSAVSPDDGRPGAWVCVYACKRFENGQWPRGEPKQQ